MTLPTMNIIGAGKLGKTLGWLFHHHHLAIIQGIVTRSSASALAAQQFIGSGSVYAEISSLPHADITFIATSDDSILSISNALAQSSTSKPGDIVFHCSGIHPASLLAFQKQQQCHVASIHPMHSFATPEHSIHHFAGTFCAFEGDPKATDVLCKLFGQLGATLFPILGEKKATYHAAGVFASNYLVTLLQESLNCLDESGVEKTRANQIILNLMHNTLTNFAKTLSPKSTLTGPLKRGDIATVSKHLAALKSKTTKELYAALGIATLPLTNHDEALHQAIIKLLTATNPH